LKFFLFILSLSYGLQAYAQLKSPEGIELNAKVALAFEDIEFVQYKPGVYDYALEDLNESDSADYSAYKLYSDLGNACINATKIPGDDLTSFGYIFHFEDCDVWYLSLYGGIVKGSIHFK